MAPNLIGSTFILAETAIKKDANNNKTATAAATCPAASNNRVPSQGESASAMTAKVKTFPVGAPPLPPYEPEIVWFNVMLFVILHSMAGYGLYLTIAENAYLEFFFSYLYACMGGLGITAGVHRLWSHRSYKAKLPLRIFLAFCQSLAFQNSIYEWTRDHRVHHKFTDTHADPHNSRRGFFFAHMGWLMCKKHPDVKEKGKQIDMSDVMEDPVVRFQKKYYFVLMPLCCFIVPTYVTSFIFGTNIVTSFFISVMLRYTLTLHATWLVNSAAHFYGMKPYDATISSVDSKLVSALAFGEGWHNYHHVFPWDYKAGELGSYNYNWTNAFLHYMAHLGQAYDLKSVSTEMILKRVRRTGDGSHPSMKDVNNNALLTEEMIAGLDHDNEENLVWGWDDRDVCEEDRKSARYYDKVLGQVVAEKEKKN